MRRNINIFLFYCMASSTVAEIQHNYYWKDYRGTIPHDAYRFKNLFIAQAPYNGLLPAALYPERREAVTEAFGVRLVLTLGIKLLCDVSTDNFYWDYVNIHKLTEEKLKDCVVGGLESNSTLYIGKLFHQGEWKIGKVFPPTSEYVGFRSWNLDGSLLLTEDFEILKYRQSPIGDTKVSTISTPNGLLCSTAIPTNFKLYTLSPRSNSLNIFVYFCVMALQSAENLKAYYWRDYNGSTPKDAIEIDNIFIAQMSVPSGLLPGVFCPEKGEAVTLYNGTKFILKKKFKILCGKSSDSFFWEYVNVNTLTADKLEDLFVGGTENNNTLYVGKVFHEGQWKVGKVYPPTSEFKGLSVWTYRGEKHVAEDFQILKYRRQPL